MKHNLIIIILTTFHFLACIAQGGYRMNKLDAKKIKLAGILFYSNKSFITTFEKKLGLSKRIVEAIGTVDKDKHSIRYYYGDSYLSFDYGEEQDGTAGAGFSDFCIKDKNIDMTEPNLPIGSGIDIIKKMFPLSYNSAKINKEKGEKQYVYVRLGDDNEQLKLIIQNNILVEIKTEVLEEGDDSEPKLTEINRGQVKSIIQKIKKDYLPISTTDSSKNKNLTLKWQGVYCENIIYNNRKDTLSFVKIIINIDSVFIQSTINGDYYKEINIKNYFNYRCNLKENNDVLEFYFAGYAQDMGAANAPNNIEKPILKIYKKNRKYYGISRFIGDLHDRKNSEFELTKGGNAHW